MQAVRAAGAREWSDDVEAVSGMLGAADVLQQATGSRRQLARDLVRRRFTPSDVLTWLVHWIGRGKGPGWLCVVLRRDPEAVGKCRSNRRGVAAAAPLLAGAVDVERQRDVAAAVAIVAARAAVPAPRVAAAEAAVAVLSNAAASDAERAQHALRFAWLLPAHERDRMREQLRAKMAPSHLGERRRLRLLG